MLSTLKPAIKMIPGVVQVYRLRNHLPSREAVKGHLKSLRIEIEKLPPIANQIAQREQATIQKRIDKYIANYKVRKLHLGCGKNIFPDWLNSDFDVQMDEVIWMDCTQPLPIPSQSFDYILSEHMIEHISYEHGKAFLAECFRIMKPGGVIRVSCPNLRQIVGLLREDRTPLENSYMEMIFGKWIEGESDKPHFPSFIVNNLFRNWGHQFIYDKQTLTHSLAAAGFTNIKEYTPKVSDDPNLVGLENHSSHLENVGGFTGIDFDNFTTMVFEATRP
jgi:predicted SAM-dependent methyltransferase